MESCVYFSSEILSFSLATSKHEADETLNASILFIASLN